MAGRQANRAAARTEKERKKAKTFLEKAAKEPGAQAFPSGLMYKEIKAGDGPSPTAADTVKAHYHGTLTDGSVFDSSVQRGQPMEFPLPGVIKCWQEGIPKMKVGGKAKLVCPAEIAYGDRGGGGGKIPGGAALAFEVELLEVMKPAPAPDAGKDKAFLEKAAKEPGAKVFPSGLIYTEIQAGTGPGPSAADAVKAHYKGTLVDGTVFDASLKHGTQPLQFSLNGVIPCWTEGIQKMKKGGKAKLVCPSVIAYGDRGMPGAIPGGATLIFEVELVDIVKP